MIVLSFLLHLCYLRISCPSPCPQWLGGQVVRYLSSYLYISLFLFSLRCWLCGDSLGDPPFGANLPAISSVRASFGLRASGTCSSRVTYLAHVFIWSAEAQWPWQKPPFWPSMAGFTKWDKPSACPVCLGRHRHRVASCQATKMWNGKDSISTRTDTGVIGHWIFASFTLF